MCGRHTGTTTQNPFAWHKTAKDIITKVLRGRAALTHHTKSATHH